MEYISGYIIIDTFFSFTFISPCDVDEYAFGMWDAVLPKAFEYTIEIYVLPKPKATFCLSRLYKGSSSSQTF
jgi:hypothetical protein